ncbi:MAG TPA: PDZ domain-containing protein [Thermoanaerobaculaceae bacterium]|nr:PDZ domain-containing protein [Thermoanaerobaculaceae bacterium]
MNTSRFLAGFAMLLLLAAPAAAQETSKDTEKARREAEAKMKKAEQQMREAEHQMREAERAMRNAAEGLGHLHMDRDLKRIERRVVIFGDRARLGLVLQSEKNPKTDAIGAYVEALTPGSPAEEAGLQPGDVIVKFNGEPLASAKVEADEDESIPTTRLMELARNLKDGDKVTLEYRRGDQTRTVTVTATRAVGPRFRMVTVPEARLIDIAEIDVPDVPDINVDVYTVGRPWRDMELVALNAELGEYFGTAEGILVVRTSKDSPLKLKAGDVILKIGDRTPGTPAQAMRILRSYEPGESIALQVMRKREKLTISVQAPPHRTGSFRWYGDVPKPPEAPEAPAAPAPNL